MTPLDYVISRACEKFKHNGCDFTTANFQSELSRVSASTPMVTPQIAELILMSVPGVVRGNGPSYWKFMQKDWR